MRKFLVVAMAVCLVGAFASSAKAYDGDFEISGHINTGAGFQYRSNAIVNAFGGAFTEEGMLAFDANFYAAGTKLGQLLHHTDALFYVGDVELDIAKTFGENIRLRVDLDFGRFNSYSYQFAINNMIEQAYATVNIPVGYGLEFLVGRFNAPMGFEAVDNNDNDLPLHTMIFNFLRPQNLTGIKFYYPFSDLIDLHFWLANNLRDIYQFGGGTFPKEFPAVGLRLGFTWGLEGQESTIGISGATSAESQQANVKDKWGDWTYLGDLDFNVWVNDVFAIGGEGIFRLDGAAKGTKKNMYYAGLLNLHYVFSDVWDGTLRYTYANDKSGTGATGGRGNATLNGAAGASQFHRYAALSALGWKLSNHAIDLGINYHITDGAKLGCMYRFEYMIPAKMGLARSYANANKTGMIHSVAANFAYEF